MAPRKRNKPATTASAGPTAGSTPAPRTYESTPVLQQQTFPARRRVVKTYGGRRSLPAELETTEEKVTGRRSARSPRQQTLTQIDYVRPSGVEVGDSDGSELGLEFENEEVKEGEVAKKATKVITGKETRVGERRSKRRKTMGDEPTPTLERKGSGFHTQTLTQFLGKDGASEDQLRLADEVEEQEGGSGGLRPPENPVALANQLARTKAVRAKALPSTDPHTPSHQRIKVNLDEVPSSQPTPFTPLLGQYSPLPSATRSPLTQKSTNVDAPPPTIETISKLPRNLVIQDSYSTGSSGDFPSSSIGGETPKKAEEMSEREPLAEIPVASLELGATPLDDETPTTTRKRLFVEIPDSDDELESIGSTPFTTRSTQQTPLRMATSAAVDFDIPADPGSSQRLPGVGVSNTPSGRSDKENSSPAIKVWKDGESTPSEAGARDPGTPTPKFGSTRPQSIRGRGRASQVSPNTASQFWTASSQDIGHTTRSDKTVAQSSTTLVSIADQAVDGEEAPALPTPAPRGFTSQRQARLADADAASKLAFEDEESTASENEEEHIPTSILRKPSSRRAVLTEGSVAKERECTPELSTTEDSNRDAPGTPTPVVRRVQIALPPPSTAEEVCKETPRKPHKKSSPIYQRHTQVRSQYYSQGLESQRVPLEVIRSLGPQTDRSDILISIHAENVDEIVKGARDYEFRSYKFPMQVSRCWIYTTLPVGEVKYMATLGPAQPPGEIDDNSGLGNAEFNAGTSGFKFAHKLLQVYQLNNPVPLADMADNGLGDGPPQKYRYLPPAIVGQLLANLRCPLFADDDYDEGEEEEEEEGEEEEEEEGEEEEDVDAPSGSVTISQELEEQLRSDIIHSTQMLSSALRRRHHEEDDVIPASQSPLKNKSKSTTTGARRVDATSARPAATPPKRSSQRLRNHHQQQQQHNPHPRLPTPAAKPTTTIRPSQATTASDISSSAPPSSSSRAATPEKVSSVPRPPLPRPESSSEQLSLPHLRGTGLGGGGQESSAGSSFLPLPLPVGESLLLSSSQAMLLPPDSLLVDDVRMAPPPVVVWDSEDEEGEGEQ